MIKRPVLRYHGGKFLLAKWIISNFPKHRTYTEVFGGGGSVLMQKNRCYSEVYNDIWDEVVNVFQVLRNKELAQELENQIRLTPYSRTEFFTYNSALIATMDPVERARKTILRSFAGFGSASTNGDYATGFRANSNRLGTTPAHDWKNYPNNIKSFIERLQGVVIENKDYKEVLLQHDTSETLHFLDPPYVHETRNMQRGNAAYKFEFSDQDHVEMAKIVEQLQGIVIICGYQSDLYNTLFDGWHLIKRKAFADGASQRIECLWMNRKPHTLF